MVNLKTISVWTWMCAVGLVMPVPSVLAQEEEQEESPEMGDDYSLEESESDSTEANLEVEEDVSLDAGGGGLLDGQLPMYAHRQLTLQKGRLRIDGAPLDFALYNSGRVGSARGLIISRQATTVVDSFGDVVEESDVGVALASGATFGILDDLEAGILLLPIIFSPEFDFGDIELFGRYRFLKNENMEIGGQLTMRVPTNTEFAIAFGAPLRMRVGEKGRLDTGLEIEIETFETVDGFGDTTTETNANLDIPVAFNMNVTDDVFVGGRSGIFLPDFDFDFFTFPLGVQGGYTLPNQRVDLVGWFVWPSLLQPAAPEGLDKIHADIFEIGLGASIYLDVMKP